MDIKAKVRGRLDGVKDDLVLLSRRLHAHPETGFEEVRAAAWIAQLLERAGFAVAREYCGLPTAFRAHSGSGPLNVCLCAEYDALPGIGHACGHNIIAAAAVGAAIAASAAADEAGLCVTVMGTPGEEKGDGGGKILLLERGGFAGVHAAMMVHPGPADLLKPNVIAASMFEVRYRGKEAHAASHPELGINAGDALTVAQTAIGLLRQHILPTDRIHGIVTRGGDAPNIVPAHTEARYIVRGRTLAELERLRPRVYRCFEAGALATGCGCEISGGTRPYSEMRHDPDLANLYRRNSEKLGRPCPDVDASGQGISTDMGNVSLAIPAIHPMVGIDSLPAVNHQKEFADCCISESADRAIYDGALAMAWTLVDMGCDGALRERLRAGRE